MYTDSSSLEDETYWNNIKLYAKKKFSPIKIKRWRTLAVTTLRSKFYYDENIGSRFIVGLNY